MSTPIGLLRRMKMRSLLTQVPEWDLKGLGSLKNYFCGAEGPY